MRLQKITSFSSASPQEPQRMTSPGLLTRKPDKKAPFARKKAIECAVLQQKMPPFTSRLSRQKRSPRAQGILPTNSLKIINSHLQEQIKYLSPKHAQTSLFIRHNHQQPPVHHQKSQILQAQTCKIIHSHLFNTFDDIVTTDYTPNPSGISIQSIAGKSYALQTAEHSGDWFGLEGENQKLREENRRLEEEVSALKQQLQNQPFSKRCPKCRHWDALERIKSEKLQMQRMISHHKQEIDCLKQSIEQLQNDLKGQRQTVVQLSKELDASRQAEEEMDALIITLKEKIENDSLELKYLNIQQDVMKRRKEEFEKTRMDGIKKGIERDNLKKVVSQYKQKVDLLRKVIAKSRNEKRYNRADEVEISLELSMDSIL